MIAPRTHTPTHHSPRNHNPTPHSPNHHTPQYQWVGGGIANETRTSPFIAFGAFYNLETSHNGHTHMHIHTPTYNLFLLAQWSTKSFLQKHNLQKERAYPPKP